MNPELLNEPFDFQKYRVNESQESFNNIENQTNVESNIPFDFSSYRVQQPESGYAKAGRHAIRTGSRVAETILGFPGDVVNFVKYLGENLPEVPEFLQPRGNILQEKGKKVLEGLPSSKQLKDYSSKITMGFTDPQNAQEELSDEISGLATVLINPSKSFSSFKSLLSSIGSSVAKASGVKFAGEGAELLGANESQREKIELGTLFLTGLIGKKSSDKYISDLYQKARSKIPEGTMINTSNLLKSLDTIDNILSKGISTPTKDEVRKAIEQLKIKSAGGAMPLDEVVETYHNINERLSSKKLFDELNTSERKLLKKRYDLLKDEVSKELYNYGKNNKDFYKLWKSANEGFATIAQSKKVSNFLQSKLGKIPHHLAGSVALDLFLGHPVSTLGVAGSYGAVKMGELLYRISKSPTLRNHYLKVIMEAGNENLPATIKHIEALDKAI